MSEQGKTDRQQEAHLLRECHVGERSACAELVRLYRDKAVNLAYGILRNQSDAEDVAQEAFIRAFAKLSEFRGESAFYSWLYRIVINVCTEMSRKRSRQEVSYEVELHGETDAQTGRIDHRIQMNAVLDALPEHLRTILVLRAVDELSYEELAEILGIPIGTVRSRLSAAREAFRKKYEEIMGDEM